MTLTEFFSYLGAPLANHRWSWGEGRPSDGTVFLRVWQDEHRKIDGAWFTVVTFNEFLRTNPSSLGCAERVKHVELIRRGTSSYMVMCQARDVTADPREVASFDRNDVFLGGRLIDIDGDFWLERSGHKTRFDHPAKSLIRSAIWLLRLLDTRSAWITQRAGHCACRLVFEH